MDHTEAIRSGAAERYLLDELDETERSQYEEHFFDCQECAEDVQSGAAFVANAKEVLPKMTEKRVAQTVADASIGAGWTRLFWPAPVGMAAALALAVGTSVYQAAVVAPRLHQQAEAIQPAAMHFLSISRGGSNVIRLGKDTQSLGLTLSTSTGRRFAFYRCELQEPGGRVVKASVLPAPPPGEELSVTLSAQDLRPGQYELVLHGLESASGAVAPDSSRYPFVLERE